MKNLYTVLGVPPASTDAELKAAYRELALRHHPDRGGDGGCFAAITHAGSVLCDRDRRDDHDKMMRMLCTPCASCAGTGQQRVQVSFMTVIFLLCGACHGKGFYER